MPFICVFNPIECLSSIPGCFPTGLTRPRLNPSRLSHIHPRNLDDLDPNLFHGSLSHSRPFPDTRHSPRSYPKSSFNHFWFFITHVTSNMASRWTRSLPSRLLPDPRPLPRPHPKPPELNSHCHYVHHVLMLLFLTFPGLTTSTLISSKASNHPTVVCHHIEPICL